MSLTAWVLSLTGCLLFGVQSWLWAHTERTMGGYWTVILQTFGSLAVGLILLAGVTTAAARAEKEAAPPAPKIEWPWKLALVAGSCGALGALCYVLAVGGRDERVNLVLAVTAAYPAVTWLIRLAQQGKPPEFREAAGFFMLVAGVIALSWKK